MPRVTPTTTPLRLQFQFQARPNHPTSSSMGARCQPSGDNAAISAVLRLTPISATPVQSESIVVVTASIWWQRDISTPSMQATTPTPAGSNLYRAVTRRVPRVIQGPGPLCHPDGHRYRRVYTRLLARELHKKKLPIRPIKLWRLGECKYLALFRYSLALRFLLACYITKYPLKQTAVRGVGRAS